MKNLLQTNIDSDVDLYFRCKRSIKSTSVRWIRSDNWKPTSLPQRLGVHCRLLLQRKWQVCGNIKLIWSTVVSIRVIKPIKKKTMLQIFYWYEMQCLICRVLELLISDLVNTVFSSEISSPLGTGLKNSTQLNSCKSWRRQTEQSLFTAFSVCT